MSNKSKPSGIRWTKNQKSRLSRAIRNFNKRAKGTIEKSQSYYEKKKTIQSGRELNNYIKSLERFRGADAKEPVNLSKDFKVSKWAEREAVIKKRSVSIRRAFQRKSTEEANAKVGGKEVGYKRAQMGDTRTEELNPKRLNIRAISSQEEWNRAIQSMESELAGGREELYKENYLKALHFNYEFTVDDEMMYMYQVLYNHIEDMPAGNVVDIFKSDEEAAISYIGSDPIGESQEHQQLELLYVVWGLNYEDINEDYYTNIKDNW